MLRFYAVLCFFSFPLIAAESPQVSFSRLFANGNQSAYAVASSSDASGNLYIAGISRSQGFPLLNPIQRSGAIFLTKFDPAGAMVYSTLLGSAADTVAGMAVDDAGNAWLTGSSIVQGVPHAFVMKIDPAGQRILYSTQIGGSNSEQGMSIAVDRQGNAYVAGSTDSEDFPITAGSLAGARSSQGIWVVKLWKDGGVLYSYGLGRVLNPGLQIAVNVAGEPAVLVRSSSEAPYIAKVNAAGTSLVYRVSPRGVVNAIAMDPIGYLWTAGNNSTPEAATDGAAQPRLGAAIYYRSDDGGFRWNVGAAGLDGIAIYQIAFDSARGGLYAGDLYAATANGLYRSGDRGESWSRLLDGPAFRIATGTEAIYVSRRDAIVKSIDGGGTWQDVSPPGMRPGFLILALDPSVPSTVLAAGERVYRSEDAGATWSASAPVTPGVLSMAVEPSDSSIVYLGTSASTGPHFSPGISLGGGLMRSTDGGRTFRTIGLGAMSALLADAAVPGMVYAILDGRLYRSGDFGEHWGPFGPAPGFMVFNGLAFDPTGALNALRSDGLVYRSVDRGNTLEAQGEAFPMYGTQAFAYDSDGRVHVGGSRGSNAFVSKLDLSGNVVYASYWGGRMTEDAVSVAVDGAGNVYVGGWTSSPDFPERSAVGGTPQGGDAFMLKLDSAGRVVYSTTWGGSGWDQGASVAASVNGRAYLSGITVSPDFPDGDGKVAVSGRSLFVLGLR